MTTALVVIRLVAAYLAVGLGFGLWFAWRGAGMLDRAAAAGSVGFRLLVVPGAALLWPLLVKRLVERRRPEGPR
jgi:hypothetical protein